MAAPPNRNPKGVEITNRRSCNHPRVLKKCAAQLPEQAQPRGQLYQHRGHPGRTGACNFELMADGPGSHDRRLLPCTLGRGVSHNDPPGRAPPLAIGNSLVSESLMEVSLPEWLRGWT